MKILKPQMEGGWKMIFFFKWVLFRFQGDFHVRWCHCCQVPCFWGFPCQGWIPSAEIIITSWVRAHFLLKYFSFLYAKLGGDFTWGSVNYRVLGFPVQPACFCLENSLSFIHLLNFSVPHRSWHVIALESSVVVLHCQKAYEASWKVPRKKNNIKCYLRQQCSYGKSNFSRIEGKWLAIFNMLDVGYITSVHVQ